MESIDEKMQKLRLTLAAKNAREIVDKAMIADNSYEKQKARGIVRQMYDKDDKPITKLHEPDKTKFKLVVWYNVKADGQTPYSHIEKQNGRNRRYHDSIDFVPMYCEETKETEYVTRHDIAFEKLFNHLTYYSSRIDKAIMFVNDWTNNQQLHIVSWHYDLTKVRVSLPDFEQKGSHVFYRGLLNQPIKIDQLK